VVIPRLVFSLPPDSMRLSSNIKVPPALTALRHRLPPLCSQNYFTKQELKAAEYYLKRPSITNM
jgi:hypothetical protein